MTRLMNNINIFDLHGDGRHPAMSYNFDDLISKLRVDIEVGRVNSKIKDNHELFDYNSYGIFDSGWSETALLARGLVVNHRLKKIVALPFPKFFNYGEVTTELPNTEFAVTQKMDGSLGICYWDEDFGYWKVNTRGSFESSQAIWATEWLRINNHITDEFIKGNTYLFEIIYPSNKIVISYNFSGLVLLGAYHEDGLEFKRYQLEDLALRAGVKIAEEEKFNSIEEMLDKAKSLSVNEEGWVIHYPCGYRVKVKGDEYCRVHRLISNCTPLSVWDSFVAMDDFEVLKKDLPEEFRVDINNMLSIFNDLFDKKCKNVKEWINYTNNWTNKEIGLAANTGEIPKEFIKWIFANRKFDLFSELNKSVDIRKKFCKEFRPKENILEGYQPTSAMNRFVEVEGE